MYAISQGALASGILSSSKEAGTWPQWARLVRSFGFELHVSRGN